MCEYLHAYWEKHRARLLQYNAKRKLETRQPPPTLFLTVLFLGGFILFDASCHV